MTGSLTRSILACTLSVRPLGMVAPACWPAPSATTLSAAHSPALTRVLARQVTAAAAAAAVANFFHPGPMLELIMVHLLTVEARRLRAMQAIVAGTAS